MTEEISPIASDGKARVWRWRFPQVTLALSAFMMSLVVTLISAYYALKGPEILVRPPEQVILYRDGDGENAILAFAVRLDMINGISDYGDVLLDADLSPGATQPSFAYQGLVRPVFTANAQEAAEGCELGSRCVGLPGLLLIEQTDLLPDLPGGAAKAMHLAFPATQWNCAGGAGPCAEYGSFSRAVRAIGLRPLDIRIRMTLNSDGERRIRCRTAAVDAQYLMAIGWVSVGCDASTVTGEPFL